MPGFLRLWTACTLALGIQAVLGQLVFETSGRLEVSKQVEAGISNIRILPDGYRLIGYGRGAALYNSVWTRIWPTGGLNSTALWFPLAIEIDATFVGLGDTNHCIWHVLANGVNDLSFKSPAVALDDLGLIHGMQVQSDGKIVVGCGQPFNRNSPFFGINLGMFRLNTDGTVDNAFQYQNGGVQQIVISSDGKILAHNSSIVFRVLPDGSPDASFTSPFMPSCTGFALQSDGKIVVIGTFTRINGLPRPGLARLEATGALDFSFSPTVGLSSPSDVRVQPSNNGIFVISGKQIRKWFSTGAQDTSFAPRTVTGSITALDIDDSERVYYNDDNLLFQYSGHARVSEPAAPVGVVLEQSSSVDSGWLPVSTAPAGTPIDYIIDSAYPGVGNTFFRTRSGR